MVRYRIWIHPKRGDDYAYEYRSKSAAVKGMMSHKRAEDRVYAVRGRGLLHSSERPLTQSEINRSMPRKKTKRRSPGMYGMFKFRPFGF